MSYEVVYESSSVYAEVSAEYESVGVVYVVSVYDEYVCVGDGSSVLEVKDADASGLGEYDVSSAAKVAHDS